MGPWRIRMQSLLEFSDSLLAASRLQVDRPKAIVTPRIVRFHYNHLATFHLRRSILVVEVVKPGYIRTPYGGKRLQLACSQRFGDGFPPPAYGGQVHGIILVRGCGIGI
jgi:hypothetical protein